MRRIIAQAATVVVVANLTGCATFLNDDTQPVAFDSDPAGAYVYVDGTRMGVTPCVIDVPRKGWDKQIMYEKTGYVTELFTLKNSLNAAVAGNLIFGGIIGGVVDGISGRGGGYQDSVKVVLTQGGGVHDNTKAAKKAAEKNQTIDI